MARVREKKQSFGRVIILGIFLLFTAVVTSPSLLAQTESGSVGIEGRIGAPPPSLGATISQPASGARFTSTPITVSGLCPDGLLVKIFKNNVFSGSVMCESSSFSLLIDLFSGQNDIVARVFDNLDQPGPDSNTVTVFFDDNSANANGANRVILTSNFAKRGANPNDELSWPLVVSGGQGPYAVSIDWGDGQTSLQSVASPGEFIIKHSYKNSGIYKVVVKAVDSTEATAYLQLVAVANGTSGQTTSGDDTSEEGESGTDTVVLWQPMVVLIFFVIATFWLGKKYEQRRIKRAVEEGKRPF